MKFTTKKEDLQAELEFIHRITPSGKTSLAILGNVYLSAEEDGLHLLSTDLETSLFSVCSCNVKETGKTTVPAKKFYEIVKTAPPDAEIACELKDNHLKINTGRSHFSILSLSVDDYPSVLNFDEEKAIKLPADIFHKCLPLILPAITDDEARYTVSGAQLLFEKDKIRIVSTDGHRLSLTFYPHEIKRLEESLELIVPKVSLLELSRLVNKNKEETILFRRKENHISFQCANRKIVTILLEGPFPNYQKVVPENNQITVTFNREELLSAITRIALVSSRSGVVQLDMESDALTISAENPEIGEGQEQLEIEYQYEPLTMCFNSDYLIDFLKMAKEQEKVTAQIKDGASPALFLFGDEVEYEFKHVIMPMRK